MVMGGSTEQWCAPGTRCPENIRQATVAFRPQTGSASMRAKPADFSGWYPHRAESFVMAMSPGGSLHPQGLCSPPVTGVTLCM